MAVISGEESGETEWEGYIQLCMFTLYMHMYIHNTLFLKLSDGYTTPPVLFSITFFVLIQHIVTEYLLCV